jgi:hypothetical protein
MRFLRSIKAAIVGLLLIAVLFSGFAGLGTQRTFADSEDTPTVCFLGGSVYFLGAPPGSRVVLRIVDPSGNVLLNVTGTVGASGVVGLPFSRGLYPPNSTLQGIFLDFGITISYRLDTFFGVSSPNNCVGGRIGDGRINDGPNELGASLAAYCNGDGGIDVYAIDKSTSEGTLAFTASADEIASALASAASGGSSVLVGEGLGDQLWAAADGTLAVVGPDLNGEGKTYRFDFAGDTCG